MPKVKMPRKSTAVDMTAMCDVAFLLRSFFILTTKFKSEDSVSVVTPKSVSTKPAEEKNVVMITMNKDGKAFFSLGDGTEDEKLDIIDAVNETKALNLTDKEKQAFVRSGTMVGVPFSMLKGFLALSQEQATKYNEKTAPGIPLDTVNNELA